METWIPVIIAIAINIIAIVFSYGKLHQSVIDLKERLGISEQSRIRNNDRTEKWERGIEEKSQIHRILPECLSEFTKINIALSALAGKVDTLITLNKQNHRGET